MEFMTDHSNYNVLDLGRSLSFYNEALNFCEVGRKQAKDGSFILVYLQSPAGGHKVELTWLKDRSEPYNLGDNEIHLALRCAEYEQAHALHEKMGCICYENKDMGIYFISDPDGYWIEIVPAYR